MKSLHHYFIRGTAILAALVAAATNANAVLIGSAEEFETEGNRDNGGTRYLSSDFNDGSDYAERHDFGANNPHPLHLENILTEGGGSDHAEWAYTTEDGSDSNNPLRSLFASNGETETVLRLDDLNVTGFNNLRVIVALAGSDESGATEWETNKFIEIEVAFDANSGGTTPPANPTLGNGSYTRIGHFRGNGTDDHPQQDTDLNGTPDGPLLTNTLTDYTFPITGTPAGGMLSVQIRTLTAGGEVVVFDNIRVEGDMAAGPPPVLTNLEVPNISYTESDPPVTVSNNITVTDADSTMIQSAQVSITGGFDSTEDVLAASPPAGITPMYDSGLGILSLTGTASLADYTAALQSVTYDNTDDDDPSPATRTISFLATDTDGGASGIVSRDIDITPTVQSGTIPHTEDFETDGEGERYLSSHHADSTGTTSGFVRHDFSSANPHPLHEEAINNIQGDWAWVSELSEASPNRGNPLGTGAGTPNIIRLQNLNATGFSDLQVEIGLASSLDNVPPVTWLPNHSIEIQAAWDGDIAGIVAPANPTLLSGSYTTIARFVGNGVAGDGPVEDLDLDGVADAGGVQLDENLTDFTFDISGAGMPALAATGTTLSVQVVITHLAGEVVFDHIRVTGTASGPEIEVRGQGMEIASGNTPQVADDTDFGNVECATTDTHTFTILNTGGGNLNLTGSPLVERTAGSTDFSVSAQPTLNPIPGPAGSTTFQITFAPSSTGAKTAEFTISNNDADEGTYVVNVAGTGIDTVGPVIIGAKDHVVTVAAGTTFDATTLIGGITAFDACEGPIVPSCMVMGGAPPLNALPPGAHTIVCTATDTSPQGPNVSMETFQCVVLEAQPTTLLRSLDQVSLRGDTLSDGSTITSHTQVFLNNNGDVAMHVSTNMGQAIVYDGNPIPIPSGTGTVVARGGTGAPGGGNYTLFLNGRLSIDDSSAGFEAITTTGRRQFTGTSAPATVAAGAGDILPGGGTELISILQQPALDGAGQLFTPVGLQLGSGGGTVNVGNDTALLRTGLGVVAREGSLSPLGGTTDYGQLHQRVVTDEAGGGNIAFGTFLTDTPFDGSNNSGIFTGTPGALGLAVREGSTAPGTGGATFGNFLGEAVNDSNEVFFRALLNFGGGVSILNSEGLWTNQGGGGIQLVAREGDIAPCQPDPTVVFDRFTTISISNDGDLCFFAFLRGGGGLIDSTNDGSIWRREAATGELHLVAREGDSAPGTSANFLNLSAMGCNNNGGIIWLGTLTGGGTLPTDNVGIWKSNAPLSPAGVTTTPNLILRRGDTFRLNPMPAPQSTVIGLGLQNVTNAGGGTGGYGKSFNDNSEALLRLALDGSDAGIFILGTLPPDPPPLLQDEVPVDASGPESEAAAPAKRTPADDNATAARTAPGS